MHMLVQVGLCHADSALVPILFTDAGNSCSQHTANSLAIQIVLPLNMTLFMHYGNIGRAPSVVPAAKLKPMAARHVVPARPLVRLEAFTVTALMSRKACL